MKQYPSIPKEPKGDVTHFWVFDKIDGSQIRAEWSKKRGMHKFGSRKRLLGTDQGILAKAELLAMAYEPVLASIFKAEKFEKVTCFFEFYGPNSFAGNHIVNDEHRLALLDIDVYKHGMLSPASFLRLFNEASIETPKMLYYGLIDEKFRRSVVDGTLPGMTFEGVVCKSRQPKNWTQPVMFKIKSQAWIDKVKAKFDSSRWDELL